MAINFTYDEATNKVVVTGGTSGTPATFADFVTADRAGVDTILLSAGAPANNLALTYAVRPVEDLAIKVKCVVANKTPVQTDYIFITGKDWRGVAQTESVDVTAGNGSYITTKYWSEITTLDCSDNAAGGGVVWADGDLTVTQDMWGIIWDYGKGQYQLDCHFDIGDGGASTYFKSTQEQIFVSLYDDTAHLFEIKANAILHSGIKVGSGEGKMGSNWVFEQVVTGGAASTIAYGWKKGIVGAGIILSYASTWQSYLHPMDEDYVWRNPCIVIENDDSEFLATCIKHMYYVLVEADCVLKRITMWGMAGLQILAGPTIENLTNLDNRTEGIKLIGTLDGGATYIFKNIETDNKLSLAWNKSDIYMVDSSYVGFSINWTENWATGNVYESYSCNIHITDKDGANLTGVVVDCEDINGDPVWTVGTIATDANGNIAEQIIDYKHWYQPNQEETLSPHKFTISKAGYEAMVLDAVTVDGKINWHLELLPPSTSSSLSTRVYGRSHRIDVKQFI